MQLPPTLQVPPVRTPDSGMGSCDTAAWWLATSDDRLADEADSRPQLAPCGWQARLAWAMDRGDLPGGGRGELPRRDECCRRCGAAKERGRAQPPPARRLLQGAGGAQPPAPDTPSTPPAARRLDGSGSADELQRWLARKEAGLRGSGGAAEGPAAEISQALPPPAFLIMGLLG